MLVGMAKGTDMVPQNLTRFLTQELAISVPVVVRGN